jgi:hypothetical protein
MMASKEKPAMEAVRGIIDVLDVSRLALCLSIVLT